MTLEVLYGGWYDPALSCSWVFYFTDGFIRIMTIQYIIYSGTSFIVYVCIYFKI